MDASTPRDDSVLTPDVDPSAQATPVDAAAPTPDLSRTEKAFESAKARSVGVTTLTVLALLYTAYFARPFLLPLAFALLLNFLFSPVVRRLARWHIRPPLGAALVVLALLGGLGLGVYELSGPVQSWAEKAPETLSTAQRKIRKLLRPIERASKRMETAATAAGDAAATPPAREVVVREESTVSKIVGVTQHFFAAALEVVILLYFLLAAGDLFLQKLIKVLPTQSDKRKAVEIARETESSISTYLLTAASVNVGEGIVVSLAMYLLGMPNPLLWGAMVALLEFIPVFGPLLSALIIIIVAGLAGYPHLLWILFFIIGYRIFQDYVLGPRLMGAGVGVHPILVLFGLLAGAEVAGVPGIFLSVPAIAAALIIGRHVLRARGKYKDGNASS